MAESDVILRDDILKLNLEAFLPYICECVKATDLLVHLQYFTREQRKEIFKMCAQNNTAAMQRALEILLHETDVPGRFTAIRDALKDSKYPKIVQMIDGDTVPCDENCCRIIDLFTNELVRRLNPEELLPYLISHDAITAGDAEEVRAEERNHGKRRACWVLLFHLPNRVENWFRIFFEALLHCDYKDVAELLDPDLFHKIMEQKKAAQSEPPEPGKDKIRENILTDASNGSLMEKDDLEQPEKTMSAKTLIDNLNQELGKTSGVGTFLKEVEKLKLSGETACKQLVAEDVTDGKMRNKEGDDLFDSLTDVKILAQDLARSVEPNTKRYKREIATSPRRDNIQLETLASNDVNHNTASSNDIIYENNFEDADKDTGMEKMKEGIMDFDFLLAETTNVESQGENVNLGAADDVKQLVEQGDGTIEESKSDVEVDGAVAGLIEVLCARNGFPNLGGAQRQIEENMVAMGFPDDQNDLDTETDQNGEDEMEFNIATDADEVDGEDEDIPLREYQKELAREGCEGENVIVMAPTNTGKTRVACRIMQVHLRNHRQAEKIGKVIFLVENEALALQQGKECAERLPAYRTKVISGSIQRDKKQYLRDFIDRRDILVVTAQVLLNALKQKEINSITMFSMIVFDECHHTDNSHRFNEIMSGYMDLKLRQNMDAEQLPQIVGLTASLGVGGNVNHDLAMKHMKGLLANLDAKFLCTVRRNKEELRLYENNPVEKIVAAKKKENDLYKKAILDIMDIIDEYMSAHPSMQELSEQDDIRKVCRVPACGGSEKFLQWLSKFKEKIAEVRSDSVRRMMNPCRLHLEVYNKALMIHADARIKDAEIILDRFMEIEREITPKNETDVMLLELYDNLKTRNFNNEPENPKLVEMERIIMKVFATVENDVVNEDARGIIFVKTRELAQALVHWMKETYSLSSLNATEFVGQVASKADGGMTKCGQKDALEYFKGGRHKIVIATSVAEEGLDITKCNLVIRYEHVTNEIVRLQSRGRARQQDSRYYVLTEEGSWIVAKEEKNALLEKVMNIIVPQLQVYIEDHPNIWELELSEMQEEKKQEEERKEEERLANMTNNEQQFRCLNCNNFICFLSDIRKIQGAHHVVVDEEAPKRLISFRSRVPVFMHEEVKFGGGLFCGNEDCQRVLGGVCEYRHAEFPLLKIKHFRVVNRDGQGRTFKKWKDACFEVQTFTLDDLREVVERRRAAI